MPKIRDILTHVSVEVASRKRICHRNRKDHAISKGEPCVVVRDHATGGKKNYCRVCSADIFEAAKGRIRALEEDLARTS
jgi:hypothetical protein